MIAVQFFLIALHSFSFYLICHHMMYPFSNMCCNMMYSHHSCYNFESIYIVCTGLYCNHNNLYIHTLYTFRYQSFIFLLKFVIKECKVFVVVADYCLRKRCVVN
jgi:hypothetical protein